LFLERSFREEEEGGDVVERVDIQWSRFSAPRKKRERVLILWWSTDLVATRLKMDCVEVANIKGLAVIAFLKVIYIYMYIYLCLK